LILNEVASISFYHHKRKPEAIASGFSLGFLSIRNRPLPLSLIIRRRRGEAFDCNVCADGASNGRWILRGNNNFARQKSLKFKGFFRF
jgi:hypothetical protein